MCPPETIIDIKQEKDVEDSKIIDYITEGTLRRPFAPQDYERMIKVRSQQLRINYQTMLSRPLE